MSEAAGTATAAAARRAPPFSGVFGAVAMVLLVGTLVVMLYPLAIVFGESFVTEDGISFGPFVDALTNASTLVVLYDTFVVVSTSTLLSLLVGSVFAWLNERTDANVGTAADILPLVPLLVPQIAGVTGWVVLLSPQAGFLNFAMRGFLSLFGVPIGAGPVNIFSYAGLICVMTLYLVPYVYLVVSAALQQLNPSLEEAARMSGASPWKTLARVTLPAIRPAIINAGIIVLIFAISMFSVPIVIGTGAGIDLLSVRIYRLLYTYPPRLDQAISLSIFMMVFVQIALLVQVVVARRGNFAVIGGKGQAISRVELGRWRLVAKGSIVVYLLLTAVIPVIALAVVALQPFWTPHIDVAKFTLKNFAFVLFDNRLSVQAIANSIGLGLVGATVGMLLAAIFVVHSRNAGPQGHAFVDASTALPATIPHTVIAVAMVAAFTGGVLNLHGTLWILLIAYLLISLPQAVRSARSAVTQVGSDLIEAAQMARSTQWRTFSRIVLPLMLPGLVAGWVILFVYISGELTASALLSGTANPVVGLVLLNMWENGSFPQLAAISLLMTILDVAVVFCVLRLFRLSASIS